MNISELYSDSLDHLDNIIRVAEQRKKDKIKEFLQRPSEKQRILENAANNPLGLVICMYAMENSNYFLASHGYDGPSVEEWSYGYIENWFGKEFADILSYAKDEDYPYNYLEWAIKAQDGCCLSICDVDVETLDDWAFQDEYNIGNGVFWYLEMLKGYINEDVESFKKLMMKEGIPGYAIEHIGSIKLKEQGFIYDKEVEGKSYTVVDVMPDKEYDLFKEFVKFVNNDETKESEAV